MNSRNPLKDPVRVQYGHSPVLRGAEKLRHLQSTKPVCGWWHLSPGSLAPEPLPRPPPSISHSCRVPPPQPSPPTPFPSPSARHLPNRDHDFPLSVAFPLSQALARVWPVTASMPPCTVAQGKSSRSRMPSTGAKLPITASRMLRGPRTWRRDAAGSASRTKWQVGPKDSSGCGGKAAHGAPCLAKGFGRLEPSSHLTLGLQH